LYAQTFGQNIFTGVDVPITLVISRPNYSALYCSSVTKRDPRYIRYAFRQFMVT